MLEVPQLVVIDLDDTLYDYTLANKAGERALNQFIANVLNQRSDDVAVELSKARSILKSRLGEVASSHSRLLYVREFLNLNEIQIHASFALECEQVFWREYLNFSKLYTSAHDFLSYLRLRKTRMILATDLTTSIQLRKLAWLGLDKMFDLIITSEEAGGDKSTGCPEDLLQTLLNPLPTTIWSIGDKDTDHLFKKDSQFFKKVSAGPLRQTDSNRYEFSNYGDLLIQCREHF
jgi:FMN phosphatase YigB (HAD superfamily)